MWTADDIDWWLCLFDDETERLVTEYLLVGITEGEIREHYAIDPAIEPSDGLSVTDADLRCYTHTSTGCLSTSAGARYSSDLLEPGDAERLTRIGERLAVARCAAGTFSRVLQSREA